MAWLVLLTPFTWNWWFRSEKKYILVWNCLAFGIFMTLLSQLFFLLASITFCCVIPRFTFWKLHSYKHKPLFPEEQILLLVILLPFLSLSSISPLSLPSPVMQTQFFSPFYCLFLLSCLILMCWVFFSRFSVCLLSGPHQKCWATLSQ